MPALFDRRVVVQVAPPPPDFATVQNAVEVRDLRVQFRVEKTLKRDPNTAEIQISNAAPNTRALFQVRGARVVLQAGYTGTLDVVFVGDVIMAVTTRDGPDWVTRLQCGDGTRLLAHARMTTSYAGGTPLRRVITDAARKLLTREVDIGGAVADVSKQLTQGFVAHGRAADVLDRALEGQGKEWSIQDGRLQVLPAGGTATGGVVLLSPSTGLVGDIEPGSAEDTKKGRRVLRVKSLLQPQIRPGGRMRIESRGVNGTFRIGKVRHEGDTSGGAWYTEAEVSPL